MAWQQGEPAIIVMWEGGNGHLSAKYRTHGTILISQNIRYTVWKLFKINFKEKAGCDVGKCKMLMKSWKNRRIRDKETPHKAFSWTCRLTHFSSMMPSAMLRGPVRSDGGARRASGGHCQSNGSIARESSIRPTPCDRYVSIRPPATIWKDWFCCKRREREHSTV